MSEPLPPPEEPVPSARALLKERDYLLFWGTRWTGSFASQIQSVAMGWQMYALARLHRSVEESAFLVGMIGLAAFVPVFLLTLPAGEAADRYDRKKVLLLCLSGEIVSVLVLAVATVQGYASPALLLAIAALFGASRAFFAPANTALGPMLVPRKLLPRAIAWNSLAWQTASIAGPAAAGLLVAHSAQTAYFTTFTLYLVSAALVASIRGNAKPEVMPGSRLQLVKEGLAYVWRQKIVFGAISLDLFAVLLGGATALLPMFAKDILHVGPWGLGLLRGAPAAGALLMSGVLTRWPLERRVGPTMLSAVAVYGLCMVVFGLSTSFALSLAVLAISGGADMVSVVVRQTLVQIETPNEMRGRVSAVNSVFIGASNQLGEFESGATAALLGPVGSVVAGGAGTLLVAAAWFRMFPSLSRRDRMVGK